MKVITVTFNTKLSYEPYVLYIIQSAARSIYGLKTLRAHRLTGKSLRKVTQATVIARITYAVPAWRGFLNVAEKDHIESVIKKAKRYGYLPSDFENVHTLL